MPESNKRILLLLFFTAAPVLAVWLSPYLKTILSDGLASLVSWNFASSIRIYLLYVTYFIFALISGFVMWKNSSKLWYLGLSVLSLVVSRIIYGRNHFYEIQADPAFQLNVPEHIRECELESNFSTYWDYLTNGCHITLESLARSMIDVATFWVIVVLLTRLLLNINKIIRSRKNSELID